MTEYIPREAGFNAILKLVPKVDKDGYCWVIRGDAAAAIDNLPAADVRPVVLCRDCYAYRRDNELAEAAYLDPKMYCGLLRREMGEDSFCSYGKRKEEA